MTAAFRLGLRSLLTLAASALLPASAFGHATDFILVKVCPRAGQVEVELTADYGGNPMFKDKADAQAVLTRVLQVRAGDKASDLATLAPLRFEDRQQVDPTAPIPIDPTSGAEPHQLLTAVWSWKCAAQKIAFEMPADSGQSVILWTPRDPRSSGETRWAFLLPGEVSPEIAIPPRSTTAWLISCATIGLVGISATVGFSLASRRHVRSRS